MVSNDGKVKDLQKKFTGAKIIFQIMDVSEILSVERSIHKVWCEFQKIDILVNSAGVLNEKNADSCVKVNLVSVSLNFEGACNKLFYFFGINLVGHYKCLPNCN